MRRLKLLDDTEVIRLPSEAEWEYSCRAGSKTAYAFGDDAKDLNEHGWFTGNAKGNDPPVGRKKPNAWGLYDMHGYVWEWCADAWSATHEGAADNGKPRAGKGDFVIRGGSWADDADSPVRLFGLIKPRIFVATPSASAASRPRCRRIEAHLDNIATNRIPVIYYIVDLQKVGGTP